MDEKIESTVDWKDRYKELKENHDIAYEFIDKGLSLENSNKTHLAIQKYDEGIQFLDKALAVPIECPQNVDSTWVRAIKMVEQMKRTRKEILSRLSNIKLDRNAQLSSTCHQNIKPPPSVIANNNSSTSDKLSTNNVISLSNSKESISITEESVSPNYQDESVASTSTSTPYQPKGSFCVLPNVFVPVNPTKEDFIDNQTKLNNTIHSLRNSNISETPNTFNLVPKEITVEELGKALQQAKLEIDRQSAIEIFSCNNVGLCYISPQGDISMPTQIDILKIFVTEDADNPSYYLQVGRWRCPLVKEIPPCRLSRHGAFLFPDCDESSSEVGRTVGVVVPEDCEEPVVSILEYIYKVELFEEVDQEPQQPSEPPGARGGSSISSAIIKGIVFPFKVTKNISTAVKTTGLKAGKVVLSITRPTFSMRNHFLRTGCRLLMSYQGCRNTVDNIVTVAAVGFQLTGNIFRKSIADGTVDIVQHRSGQPVGGVPTNLPMSGNKSNK